jgi:hypothetical protein
VLVTGEAGIGKSSLLDALAVTVETDAGTVLVGRAIPGGGTYRAFSSALAPLLRTLPPEPPEELRPTAPRCPGSRRAGPATRPEPASRPPSIRSFSLARACSGCWPR